MWWMPFSLMSLQYPVEVIAYTTISPREGLACCLLAQLRDPRSLVLGAVAQPLEALAVEPRLHFDKLEQREPEALLAGDAGEQALQLDHAAQRRVAPQLAVQLQPPDLLE